MIHQTTRFIIALLSITFWVTVPIMPAHGDTENTLETEVESYPGDITLVRPQWDLGIGAGAFRYHLYPGAKQTADLVLPAPYFTYRSPNLEIDRGIRSFLYRSERTVLDISADFGLPVDSDDTVARKGMPDLDFMLQIGPSIEFLLNDARRSYFDIRFEVPIRLAFVSDFSYVDNIGYLIEPRFSFNHRRIARTGLSHKTTVGLKFATDDFHAYYYDVAAEYVTASRPGYQSEGGFGGSFINYRISYKSKDFIYWLFLRYQSLRGAEFEDSPLVVQNDYLFAGVGFAWIFASSL
jgi:hypothetical protein